MRNQVEYYFLTKDKIEEGANICLKKVKTILSDVEILCKNSGSESVAVALFTIAIEEYGKSILLQDCLTKTPESDGSFRVSPTIFGIKTSEKKDTHGQKVEVALKNLPDECQFYHDFVLDDIHALPWKYREKGKKLINAYSNMSKEMPDVEFGIPQIFLAYDFEIRKNLLYVDWDNEKKRWRPTLEIDPYYIEMEYDDEIDYVDGYGRNRLRQREKEVQKPEEEVFPEKLLIAVEKFREHLGII